ncbi:MAG TPA: proline--tRNA ligase [Bacillales bacterium]|nr:proline--tRNA ligase [Bacillales bacterium]
MRQNQAFVPTLRDVPSDAEAASHRLLLRAGFIRQNAAGIYSFLPLGKRVLDKVQQIVREEMDRAGAQELLMPAIQPAELWHETGRWELYGPELMRLRDRHEREFALGATGEELITSLAREVNSYKRLPMTLYQIQTKYRDEKRPRFGLLRGREFLMKDAYSFNTSIESLDESYQQMYEAYEKVFTRCGLRFRAVLADSGEMGGKDTQEFMALAEIGEDTIAYSDASSYASNVEMAEVIDFYEKSDEPERERGKIDRTTFENAPASKRLQSRLYAVDDRYVLVVLRGDHSLNEVKFRNALSARKIELVDDKTVEALFNCDTDALGPFHIPDDVKVTADYAVRHLVNGFSGAGETDTYYENVNPERDFSVEAFYDLREIQEGDPSPDGKGTIRFARGIEVGQIFKLGTFYSETMNAHYLDENGKACPMIMGCYGIGVSRTVAAIVEQHHDEDGMIWPLAVAPYQLHLIAVNMKNDAQAETAERLYETLNKSYEVLFDDRKERAGVKFADADLIGLPVRITVGKKAAEGIVELKVRATGEVREVRADEIETVLPELLKSLAGE